MLCWRARFAWRCTCALSNCTPACFLMGRMFLTRQAGLVGMKLRRFQTNVKSPKVQVGIGGEFLLNNIAWLEMPSVVWNYQNTMCMHSCCAQCYPWCVAVMNWRKLRRLCGVGATTHTPLHCDNAASLFYQAVSLTTQIIYSGAFCCHVLCVRLNVFHLFNIVFLMQILDFWRPFVDAPFTCHLQLTPDTRRRTSLHWRQALDLQQQTEPTEGNTKRQGGAAQGHATTRSDGDKRRHAWHSKGQVRPSSIKSNCILLRWFTNVLNAGEAMAWGKRDNNPRTKPQQRHGARSAGQQARPSVGIAA